MLANFYQKNIIEKPKLIFSILLFVLIIAFYFSKDFRLDASSETLLLENDPDLIYLNEINEKTLESDTLSHTSFEKDYYKH